MADMKEPENPSSKEETAPEDQENPEQESPEGSEPDYDDVEWESDEEILKQAHERMQVAQDAESEIRKLMLEDLRFREGMQWPAEVQQERARDSRPCNVINRIPQFIQQVTNDQRQNRPSIKVHPVSDGAREDTAKIIQGLVKHIEYNSSADIAYDTACESQVTCGLGYFRVLNDFATPTSFDQELFIKRIRNVFSVFFDPYSQEPDGSDAKWAFIDEYLSPDDFKRRYPESKMTSMSEWDSLGNSAPQWVRDKQARIAEYFYITYKSVKMHLLSTGESVSDEDLHDKLADAKQAGIADVKVTRMRTAQLPVVKWCKITAMDVLEKTVIPGEYIPIIPVYGAEIYIEGKRILEGLVRHAKDPQRMLNYWKSAQTEAIALAPRAPFIVAEGQLEGYKSFWETANRRNHAYLPYKPTTIAGVPAPPPQRQSFEPAIQAITSAAMQAADDLKATTGIYDQSLGAGPSDTSGIAIQRRNTQAQTSNFHFTDNLTRSMRHCGRVLIGMIPKVYDTARTARIIGDDGTHKMVQLNQDTKNEKDEPAIYQMDAGIYDVTVDVGPSYASKRQEAAASMQSLAQSYPQIMGIAGDLYVKNMDWPGKDEIAERIKKSLPPGLADDSKQQQVPPQVQSQMQQMGQMIDQLTQQLHQASQVIEMKQLELSSKERIEFAKIQADLEINAAKLGSQESMHLLQQEVSAITARLKLIGFGDSIQDETQQFEQQFASQAPAGATGADGGAPGPQGPTGGQSPGQPMEQPPQGPMQ